MFKRIGDSFSTIGNNIVNVFSHIGKSLPTFLSVVAVITIIDYLTSRQGNWYLPILVIVTGLMAIILPVLCSRFEIFYSIISTGWALLLIQTICNYIPMPTTFAKITVIVFFIASITDFCLGHTSFSDAIFNIILSFVSAKLIGVFETEPLTIVLVLLVIYALVITFKLNVFFSLKKNKNKTVNTRDTNLE